MSVCTFFGHRDCPETIKPQLREAVVDLIVNHGVDMFYVGHQGRFDGMVHSVLRQIAGEYPHVRYGVVLAYLPTEDRGDADLSDTMYPEGLEQVHPKYAISWRNDWMLRQSDYVITYVTRTFGGAARYAAKAKRQNRVVIPLR